MPKIDETRRSADARAAELRNKPKKADGPESHWQQVQSDFDQHVQRTRAQIDATKAAIDANDAKDDAEWAEIDAEDAINFAGPRSWKPNTRSSTLSGRRRRRTPSPDLPEICPGSGKLFAAKQPLGGEWEQGVA